MNATERIYPCWFWRFLPQYLIHLQILPQRVNAIRNHTCVYHVNRNHTSVRHVNRNHTSVRHVNRNHTCARHVNRLYTEAAWPYCCIVECLCYSMIDIIGGELYSDYLRVNARTEYGLLADHLNRVHHLCTLHVTV